MAKKKNSSREDARKFHAIHQRLDQLEQDIQWLKREVRKLTAKEDKK
ncbi:hypothetical protein LCGC14_1018610 [marine sediment metagenome]|uniref:Uncharacterized protein n=1 Tax=marine sediment metagenome TaxID=412755 RepID=A0A0F9N2N5_9ZZZZ